MLKLKITEQINFRNEQIRKIEVEEYKKQNADAVENFDRTTKEMKDRQQEYENLKAELQRAKIDQDAKIEQLEREGNKREELQEIIKRQNHEMISLQEASLKKNKQMAEGMSKLSTKWSVKDEKDFFEFLIDTGFLMANFLIEKYS